MIDTLRYKGSPSMASAGMRHSRSQSITNTTISYIVVISCPGNRGQGRLEAGAFRFRCALGRGGVSRNKREGDGGSLAGGERDAHEAVGSQARPAHKRAAEEKSADPVIAWQADIDDKHVTVEMCPPWRTNDDAREILHQAADGNGPEMVAARKELQRIAKDEDDIVLTYAELSRWLRLGYAYTYYSIQGRTIRDRTLLLLDNNSKHFTVRNLIVGISRAPLGSQIKIPSLREEGAFMQRLPDVPDEVDKNAAEEVFEEDDVEEEDDFP
jgi:hypothetical protein